MLLLTRNEFLENYWNYYLMLERKFIHTLNYVELSEENYKVFSNEYANLMYSIGAELDAFFKIYCSIDSKGTIKNYCKWITENKKDLLNRSIYIHNKNIVIRPLNGWSVESPGKSLSWWTAYTNIKHNRFQNKKDGSLKNVLYILGTLYLLEYDYFLNFNSTAPDYDKIWETSPSSSLFNIAPNTRIADLFSPVAG